MIRRPLTAMGCCVPVLFVLGSVVLVESLVPNDPNNRGIATPTWGSCSDNSRKLSTLSSFDLSASSDEEKNSTAAATRMIAQRMRQIRRKPVNRRPKYYWLDANNLRNELVAFWKERGVKLSKYQAPPIPNEVLLMHYKRHDLRAAISKNGGRQVVSQLLGGAPIVQGRWLDALQQSSETQALVKLDPNLSVDRPPKVSGPTSSRLSSDTSPWSHQNGRKKKGFWNIQSVLQELYVRTVCRLLDTFVCFP
jgi:hypothetical protein